MVMYAVEQLDDVILTGGPLGKAFDLMSPFVWREDNIYRILVRGVPYPLGPTDPTGIIGAGYSTRGLEFRMDAKPTIAPGPDAIDAGGCEDPTLVFLPDGRYLIFYTGLDAGRAQSALILAEGRSLASLAKVQMVLKAPPGEGNIKEATLAQTRSGEWRLFYEYAAGGASRIGMAASASPDGPWTVLPDPFGIREDSWDNWHLSTGPIITVDGQDPVMFYNGATRDARWRIGWVTFDINFSKVTGRGLEPLLVPPPPIHRDSTDIAFAASTVMEGDLIALYYSLEDRLLQRALIRLYV